MWSCAFVILLMSIATAQILIEKTKLRKHANNFVRLPFACKNNCYNKDSEMDHSNKQVKHATNKLDTLPKLSFEYNRDSNKNHAMKTKHVMGTKEFDITGLYEHANKEIDLPKTIIEPLHKPIVKTIVTSTKHIPFRSEKESKSIADFIKSFNTVTRSDLYRSGISDEVRKNVTSYNQPSRTLISTTTVSNENTNFAKYTEKPGETIKSTVVFNEYDTYEEINEHHDVPQKKEPVTTPESRPETVNNTYEYSEMPPTTLQPEIQINKEGSDKMNINFNIGDVKIAIDAPKNLSSEDHVVQFAQKMYENLLQLRKVKPLETANFTKYDKPQEFSLTEDKERSKPDNPYAAIIHHSPNEPSHGAGSYHSVASQLASRVRVLCWIMTEPDRHATFAVHVKATWGRRCNKLIFMSTAKDINLPSVNLYVPNERDYLWEKTKEAFSYVHKHHRNEADWFLKADDDTYVIMENLRYMLADYNSSEPMYFGCRFKPYTKQGYMSGGAGYVLSRAALNRLNRAFQIPNMCNTLKTSAEDVELGKCMERIGVRAMDSRDIFGRERFFPFHPREHFVPDREKNAWYFSYLYYPAKEGLQCCSNTGISFHGLTARDMYIMEYLVYHLRPHGTPLLDDEKTLKKTLFSVESPDVPFDYWDRKKKILPVAEIHYNTLD